MQQYEVTFIVDPVLSKEEIGATAKTYEDQLKELGAEIVHMDDMGLKQLAYPIMKRTSGIYYCIEFKVADLSGISAVELAMRRDDRVMRFLTVKLDKYGVQYNEDKRAGKIGKSRSKKEEEVKPDPRKQAHASRDKSARTAKKSMKREAPKTEKEK
ncbi:MAG: 30S ribosomal protein S6 [Bacteroidota bacterium]